LKLEKATMLKAGHMFFTVTQAFLVNSNEAMMRTILALCLLAGLAASASAQSTADIVKRKQDAWMRCLKESYGVNHKHNPDRNAAMEMAFRACTTEEDDLWNYSAQSGVPRSSFMSLKSEIKQVILEGK
jgi:hypothetical protein